MRSRGSESFKSKSFTQRHNDMALLGRKELAAHPQHVEAVAQARMAELSVTSAQPKVGMTQKQLTKIVHSLEDKCNMRIQRILLRLEEESKFRGRYESAMKRAEELTMRNEALHESLNEMKDLYESEKAKKDPSILPDKSDWIDTKLVSTLQSHLSQMLADEDDTDTTEIVQMREQILSQKTKIDILKNKVKGLMGEIHEHKENLIKKAKQIEERDRRFKEIKAKAARDAVRKFIMRNERNRGPKPKAKTRRGRQLWARLKGRMQDVIALGIKWKAEEDQLTALTGQLNLEPTAAPPGGDPAETEPQRKKDAENRKTAEAKGARGGNAQKPGGQKRAKPKKKPPLKRSMTAEIQERFGRIPDEAEVQQAKRAETSSESEQNGAAAPPPTAPTASPAKPTGASPRLAPETEEKLISEVLRRGEETQIKLRQKPALTIVGNPRLGAVRSKALKKRLAPLRVAAVSAARVARRSASPAGLRSRGAGKKPQLPMDTLPLSARRRRKLSALPNAKPPPTITRKSTVQNTILNATIVGGMLRKVGVYESAKRGARQKKGELALALSEANGVVVSLSEQVNLLKEKNRVARRQKKEAEKRASEYFDHAARLEDKLTQLGNENYQLIQVSRHLEAKLQKRAGAGYTMDGEEFSRLQLHYDLSRQLVADMREIAVQLQQAHNHSLFLRSQPPDSELALAIRKTERRFKYMFRLSNTALDKFEHTCELELDWIQEARRDVVKKQKRSRTPPPRRPADFEAPAPEELYLEPGLGEPRPLRRPTKRRRKRTNKKLLERLMRNTKSRASKLLPKVKRRTRRWGRRGNEAEQRAAREEVERMLREAGEGASEEDDASQFFRRELDTLLQDAPYCPASLGGECDIVPATGACRRCGRVDEEAKDSFAARLCEMTEGGEYDPCTIGGAKIRRAKNGRSVAWYGAPDNAFGGQLDEFGQQLYAVVGGAAYCPASIGSGHVLGRDGMTCVLCKVDVYRAEAKSPEGLAPAQAKFMLGLEDVLSEARYDPATFAGAQRAEGPYGRDKDSRPASAFAQNLDSVLLGEGKRDQGYCPASLGAPHNFGPRGRCLRCGVGPRPLSRPESAFTSQLMGILSAKDAPMVQQAAVGAAGYCPATLGAQHEFGPSGACKNCDFAPRPSSRPETAFTSQLMGILSSNQAPGSTMPKAKPATKNVPASKPKSKPKSKFGPTGAETIKLEWTKAANMVGYKPTVFGDGTASTSADGKAPMKPRLRPRPRPKLKAAKSAAKPKPEAKPSLPKRKPSLPKFKPLPKPKPKPKAKPKSKKTKGGKGKKKELSQDERMAMSLRGLLSYDANDEDLM